MLQALGQGGHFGPGDDGQNRLAGGQLAAQFSEYSRQILRLDRQRHQVGGLNDLPIVVVDSYPVLVGQIFPPPGHRLADSDVGRRGQPCGQHTAQDRLGHSTAADKSQAHKNPSIPAAAVPGNRIQSPYIHSAALPPAIIA